MIVKDINTLQKKMAEVRAAQQEYATYTQEQVDEIFFQVAMAANQARIPLAKMAAEESDYIIMLCDELGTKNRMCDDAS